MSRQINSYFGLSLVASGCCVALWAICHPWGTVAGPEVGASSQWAWSHTFHFLGGLFGSFGLLGLAGRQLRVGTRFERAAFLIAFAGTVMYTATGVITAFVWPILAEHAPMMTEASGPIFSPPHPVIGITALVFSLGFILLAITLDRAKILNRLWTAALIVGALLLIPPPPPLSSVPWALFPVGGLLFGIGVVGIGLAIWRGRVPTQIESS